MNRREFLLNASNTAKRNYNRVLTGAREVQWVKQMLKAVDPPSSRVLVALLNEDHCLVSSGTDCQSCYVSCPLRDQAIVIQNGQPTISSRDCDGCGLCEIACDSVNHPSAIRMKRIA